MDELEAQLRKRDPRFLVRIVLALGVAVLAGISGLLLLSEADVGGCAARGFDAVTEPAATPAAP